MLVAAPRTPEFPAIAQPFAPIKGAFDATRDLEEVSELPDQLRGSLVDVETSVSQEETGYDLYAAHAEGQNAWRVKGAGIEDALRAAQHMTDDALAVVQTNDGASRYLVPLGVWTPADESMFSFNDVGGTPHDNGPEDYLHVSPQSDVHVEALVFDGGKTWIDWSGHAKPGASSADVLGRYGDILKAAGAWKTDTSNPRQLAVRFLDNGTAAFADRLLRDSIEGVDLVLQTKSGKPLPKHGDRYADESAGLPTYFLKQHLAGVVGASIGAGDTSIPSVTYTDTERSATLLRNAIDTSRPLDGNRRWDIEPLA